MGCGAAPGQETKKMTGSEEPVKFGGRYRTRTVPAGNEAVEQRPRKALLRPAGRFGVCVVEWC